MSKPPCGCADVLPIDTCSTCGLCFDCCNGHGKSFAKAGKTLDRLIALLGDSLSELSIAVTDDVITATVQVYGGTEHVSTVRLNLRPLFGPDTFWYKDYTDYSVTERRTTEDGIKIALHMSRASVCRKVDTGLTETVEVPDYSNVPTKTVTRPITRWECS